MAPCVGCLRTAQRWEGVRQGRTGKRLKTVNTGTQHLPVVHTHSPARCATKPLSTNNTGSRTQPHKIGHCAICTALARARAAMGKQSSDCTTAAPAPKICNRKAEPTGGRARHTHPPPSPTPSMTARIKQLSCLGGPPSAWGWVSPVGEGGGGGSRECRAQFPQTQNGDSGTQHTRWYGRGCELPQDPAHRAACQVHLACLRVCDCAVGSRSHGLGAEGKRHYLGEEASKQTEVGKGATCPPNTAPHLGRGVAAVRAAVDLLYLPVRPLMGGHHRAAPGRELAVPESRGNVGK